MSWSSPLSLLAKAIAKPQTTHFTLIHPRCHQHRLTLHRSVVPNLFAAHIQNATTFDLVRLDGSLWLHALIVLS
jgi:hypothetical protein